jgi:hypothetical protein
MKNITLSCCLCLLVLVAHAQRTNTSAKVFNADTLNKSADSAFIPLKYRNIHKRSPVLACLLSVYIPGLGQVYNKQYFKGGILFGTFAVSFVAAEIYVNSNRSFYPTNHIYTRNDIRHPNDAVTAALLLPMAASVIYSIVDAPITASWLNRTYHLGKKKHNLSILSIEPGLVNLSPDRYRAGVNLILR